MAKYDFLNKYHVVNGIVPKADAFATAGVTDWVNLKNYRSAVFIVHTGNATSGTANGVVTVKASASAAGSSTTSLAFKYRVCASSTTVDTWGALTDAASTGFVMTAGDNYIYIVEVVAEDVEAQAAGKPFVSLTVTEDTNDPVDAAVLILLGEPRYSQSVPLTAIA
jgi:hypothetical protein